MAWNFCSWLILLSILFIWGCFRVCIYVSLCGGAPGHAHHVFLSQGGVIIWGTWWGTPQVLIASVQLVWNQLDSQGVLDRSTLRCTRSFFSAMARARTATVWSHWLALQTSALKLEPNVNIQVVTFLRVYISYPLTVIWERRKPIVDWSRRVYMVR